MSISVYKQRNGIVTYTLGIYENSVYSLDKTILQDPDIQLFCINQPECSKEKDANGFYTCHHIENVYKAYGLIKTYKN